MFNRVCPFTRWAYWTRQSACGIDCWFVLVDDVVGTTAEGESGSFVADVTEDDRHLNTVGTSIWESGSDAKTHPDSR